MIPQQIKEKVLRTTVKAVVRPVFSGHLPIKLQRPLLRELSRISLAPRGVKTKSVRMGQVKARQVMPKLKKGEIPAPVSQGAKAILFLHGGAYIIGSPATHTGVAGHLSHRTGMPIWIPDYRLAPEHPFPAALEDAKEAYAWLMQQGYLAQDIHVVGDSAGGGLALALAISLRDAGIPLPASLTLMSPWVDLTMPEYDGKHVQNEIMLSRLRLITAARYYSGGLSPSSPLISVINADLEGLPPTLIQVGTDEMLLDDSRRLVKKLQVSDVPVQYEEFPDMWHVFQLHAGILDVSDRALQRVVGFIEGN